MAEQKFPVYKDFRDICVKHGRLKNPNAVIASDNEDLLVISEGDINAVISLDKLYRAYIDLAIQNPNATQSELMDVVMKASDAWRNMAQLPPVFKIEEIAELDSSLLMKQKCIQPPPD